MISNICHYENFLDSYFGGKLLLDLCSKIYLFIFMCTGMPYTCCAHGGQKRISGPLDLELQMVESCYMGAGNKLNE